MNRNFGPRNAELVILIVIGCCKLCMSMCGQFLFGPVRMIAFELGLTKQSIATHFALKYPHSTIKYSLRACVIVLLMLGHNSLSATGKKKKESLKVCLYFVCFLFSSPSPLIFFYNLPLPCGFSPFDIYKGPCHILQLHMHVYVFRPSK